MKIKIKRLQIGCKYASHVRTLLKDELSPPLKYTGYGYILTDATQLYII